ncbi:MAG: tRNA glutamyl-Q(34) synthetase GluQRS [Candidatus Muproteobacteria bacterium RBG_16_62_13]|uniref:Glutamyl-Q tRNA(Asp) synthetase n=1 Tax=Candidatus Muproteobacteria bacterium RBG_16_62_13 TaxID=1817756 RepID=A0A1F6T1C9_9PROT|nr:MAG: tRNA glutamyl-Q(34) synthetase GluQRS [Candidatus Muproteobacteria bacterium RBG_16_62_13]
MTISKPYRGRFAPSPTGPLHFGSMAAAVGSFLQAKSRGGEWLVRMEDIDPPREVPGAADEILRTLETFGLSWDGAVMYQSRRHGVYEAALKMLERIDAIYPCACSRREIADSSVSGVDGPVYPGTCRVGLPAGRTPRAWRVRVNRRALEFVDAVQGRVIRDLAADFGDFVVRRADGYFAYQLAVVMDDAEQGITEIVRGADLIESTPRQIHLQRLLGLPTPDYVHLPVALNARNEKLSKQTFAAPADVTRPVSLLCQVLRFLGQEVPPELADANVEDFWRWAVAHWRVEQVPRVTGVVLDRIGRSS